VSITCSQTFPNICCVKIILLNIREEKYYTGLPQAENAMREAIAVSIEEQ
jgi:hypothetical protein